MSVLELESLLEPVSPDEPCGPDLQYDADFIALETATQGKPEQQYGDTIIPAEEPEWKEVKQYAESLLPRTKDLRIACHLTRALAETDGFAGVGAGLSLVRGYLEQYWPTVHPLLDPEDDNDPTERVNIVSSLADKFTTVAQINAATIVRSAALGKYSMRDVLVARGDASPTGDETPPEMAAIEGAFLDCDFDELRETAEAAAQAYDDAVAIEATVTDQVGAANATSLEVLTHAVQAIRDYLQAKVGSREAQEGGEDAPGDPLAAGGAVGGAAAGGGPGKALSGEVRSRDDVMLALDRICEYYDRHEPSSPLPMLLRRAKRLVSKSFMDILEDITPDGLTQARMIGGVEDSHEE